MAKNWYPASSLTGGADGSLDALDGAALVDGDRAFVITDTASYFYILDTDSGLTESSPDVISPNTNAGTKRWILKQAYSDIVIPEQNKWDIFSSDTPATLPTITNSTGAFIRGSNCNISDSATSAILSGETNVINNSDWSICMGGDEHLISGGGENVIAGGYYNVIESVCWTSAIGGGSGNNISGCNSSVICGGSTNSIVSSKAIIGGGSRNNITAEFGSIIGGSYGQSYLYGQESYASGRFSIVGNGDAQRSELVARIQTIDSTQTDLFLDGTTLYAVLPASRTWHFRISLVALQTVGTGAGSSAIWNITGCIKRDASNNTSLVGTPQGTGTPNVNDRDAGASTWSIAVAADDTNEALSIKATGETDKTIHWVAKIELVEVG